MFHVKHSDKVGKRKVTTEYARANINYSKLARVIFNQIKKEMEYKNETDKKRNKVQL